MQAWPGPDAEEPVGAGRCAWRARVGCGLQGLPHSTCSLPAQQGLQSHSRSRACLTTAWPRAPAQGDSEIGQLLAIFQVLGTPGEADWPGLGGLPHWQACFPRFRGGSLREARGRGWAGAGLCLAIAVLLHLRVARLVHHARNCSAGNPHLHTGPHSVGPCSLDPSPQAVPQLDVFGADLLARMLCCDPAQRVTCREALAHPWFEEVRQAEAQRAQRTAAAVRRGRQERGDALAAAAAVAAQLLQPGEPRACWEGNRVV